MSKPTILCAGEPILDVTRVLLRLDGSSLPIMLDLAEKATEGNIVEYRFVGPEVSVDLLQRYVGAVTLFYIDARVEQQGQGFHKQRSLAPQGAVQIELRETSQVRGLMGNYQHKDWWTRPIFGQRLSDLPERVQSLLWKDDRGYRYLIPVADRIARTEAYGAEGGLGIRLNSLVPGYNALNSLAFAVGVGDDPFPLSEQVVEQALAVLPDSTPPRSSKTYPEICDYLGWCSWDAFYRDVSAEGLRAKAQEFKDKGLPVRWVMIDDGWLDVKDNQLWSFAADSSKFPDGLQSITEQLKAEFGIGWVGVWHTSAGYWDGIHPDSGLAKEYGSELYFTRRGRVIPGPNATGSFRFWNAWHSQLRDWGIDFVKVDGQSAVANFLEGHESIGQAARGIHAGLEASVGLHFNLNIINCMGMAAENIWSRPSSALSRNSDDFVPSGEISFAEHALQNVYNSFYHSHFYWGDWDMFWTNHAEWKQSAVLRCLSGGPIYTSDRVGETHPERIWPLILSDGQVLRLDNPGLPTVDCLLKDPYTEEIALKVWGTSGSSAVLGVFNINRESKVITAQIRPSEIPTLQGDRFAVYDHFDQTMQVVAYEDAMTVELQPGDVQLFALSPLRDGITPLGLLDKCLSPAAITHFATGEDGVEVVLSDGGLFGFTAPHKPKLTLVNGTAFACEERDGYFVVDCREVKGTTVLSIIG